MTLPAFLLAFADRKPVWPGWKRLTIPPINARWSLARFLFLVVMQTALAVVLGCALSLLAVGRPLGWVMWLLGLFAACEGIVVTGLMALCWNQRVARLRENPALPTSLPPARHRLARWALGLIYFAVLGLITPLAMMVTVENVYGQLAWRHARSQLVTLGERLTFREILGPEIPAAENAGAAPIFALFFDYASSDSGSGSRESELSGESSNAVARIKDPLTLPFNHLPEKPKDAVKSPKENLAEWSAAYRKLATSPSKDDPAWAPGLKLPAPGDPARDVLAGLSVADAVVAEICAASARPRALFALHWDEGFGLLLPHLAVLKSVQQNLNLRCAAHLGAGETDAAFADATNALNVSELLREEPLLISQLVRFSQGAITIRTLWQGFAEHRWADAQLAVFQERLGRVDYLAGLVRAFEGERAGGIVGVDAMIAGQYGTEQISSSSFRRAAMILPLGVLRENQVALVQLHTALLADLRGHVAQARQAGFAAPVKAQAEKEHIKGWQEPYVGFGTVAVKPQADERIQPYSPFTILAKMLIPALARAETRAARTQTMNHLAITACALERHRLAHGSYPETLEALTPALLSKPLLDPMNNQPFKYRRTDDGWFLLYSVGEDGKDDGGVFRTKMKDPIKDWPWPVPTRPEAGSLF